MPKLKIVNLKPGACVINSLKITIAGLSYVIIDSSTIGDLDIEELKRLGIISITPVHDTVGKRPKKVQNALPKLPIQKKQIMAKKGITKTGKPIKQTIQNIGQIPSKPGTDFRAVDGPEDVMGAKVVIMGDAGPEVRKMSPGINGAGPKYAGDTSYDE